MTLTANESTLVLWVAGILLSAFFMAVVWVLNKGVNRMEQMASSLTNMEKDFGILVNDHQNLKSRVTHLEDKLL
jgi:archaellum component FlaG (FlaF/FlaG flagellin family)